MGVSVWSSLTGARKVQGNDYVIVAEGPDGQYTTTGFFDEDTPLWQRSLVLSAAIEKAAREVGLRR